MAMAESRQKAEWDRTAALLLMLYNANRDPKHSRELSPEDFNPFRRKPVEQAVPVGAKEARELFQAIVDSVRR